MPLRLPPPLPRLSQTPRVVEAANREKILATNVERDAKHTEAFKGSSLTAARNADSRLAMRLTAEKSFGLDNDDKKPDLKNRFLNFGNAGRVT